MILFFFLVILSMFFERCYCLPVGPQFSSSLGLGLGSLWRGLFLAEAFDVLVLRICWNVWEISAVRLYLLPACYYCTYLRYLNTPNGVYNLLHSNLEAADRLLICKPNFDNLL